MPPLLSDQVIRFLHSEPRFEPVNELRLHIDGRALGWVRPRVAEALCQLDRQRIRVNTRDLYLSAGNDCASRSGVLQAWAMALREQGALANWRDEAMQLDQPDGTFLIIERAAFRTFGLCTPSVHLNGWVAMPDGARLWVAERSAHKFVDPGKLDNLVGGGVAAGEPLALALAREAWEEAGLHFRRVPRAVSALHIHRRIQEGIQEERIAVHDTWLPAHFLPTNQDGEVADARLMALPAVLAMLLDRHFTWDAGLVVLDGLLRQRYFGAEGVQIELALAALGYRH